MTFQIDIGKPERPIAKSAAADETQVIRFTNWTRADRAKRQIIEALQETQTVEDADAYIDAESLIIDALFLAYPDMAEEISEAHQDHRAWINPATRDPYPAEPGNPKAQLGNTTTKEHKMKFGFDSGNSGSQGPWIAWSARGTQDGTIPQRSFFLREDDGKKTVFDGFAKGVIMDIWNMKTGWQKSEGVQGVPPEWKWNASPAQMQPQPDDDYKKGIQIKCAIGGGKVATWEQAGAGAWNGFTDLVPELEAGPGDGSLPLVQLVDARLEQYKRGSTVVPVLKVIKWMPRPDCLKEGFAADTNDAPAAPAPAPAQAEVPADMAF